MSNHCQCCSISQGFSLKCDCLAAEIDRLREALENIADNKCRNCGADEIARTALEGGE